MLLISSGLVLAISSITTASVLTPRDPPTTYGTWTSLGCWGDNPVSRTLHHAVGGSSTNTVETCLDTCAAAGFPLGGVEFGSECYCGNSILYNYGSSTGCSFACSGNPGEICGGPDAINIYHRGDLNYTVGPAMAVTGYGGWHGYSNDVYEGLCYDEFFGGGVNKLPFQVLIPIEEMTVQRCLDGCTAANPRYRIAGLQFGQQCWCGATGFIKFPIGENRPNSECSIPCTGDATQFCGGTDVLMAYTN